MENVKVTCTRCGSEVQHYCNNDLKESLVKLLHFTVESVPRGFKSSDYYEKGDEDAPFFSEAFLYNAFGKEDARTILAYLHKAIVAAGYNPDQLENEK